MRIAMIGTKGIPAKWGGIEKYVEEVGKRLVKRGHEVTVFGSRWYCKGYDGDSYLGMRIVRLPAVNLQATHALSNGFWAAMAVVAGRYDIVHFHGYASYYFVAIVRRFGKIAVITTHGVESGWDNPKYGFFARRVIKTAFGMGITHANLVTTVADHLRTKIQQDFHIDAHVLPSGLDEVAPKPAELITKKYPLHGLDYLLFLGRVDPIKKVDWVLDLLTVLRSEIKIVIAGGAQDPSTEAYYESLRRNAQDNSQIIFTGPVFGVEKAELLSNCLALVAPSAHEGLPITVLEGMAYGRCSIASDIPAHQEIIEDGVTGFLFPKDDKNGFLSKVKALMNESQHVIDLAGSEAKRKAMLKFNWDETVDKIEAIYRGLLYDRPREN